MAVSGIKEKVTKKKRSITVGDKINITLIGSCLIIIAVAMICIYSAFYKMNDYTFALSNGDYIAGFTQNLVQVKNDGPDFSVYISDTGPFSKEYFDSEYAFFYLSKGTGYASLYKYNPEVQAFEFVAPESSETVSLPRLDNSLTDYQSGQPLVDRLMEKNVAFFDIIDDETGGISWIVTTPANRDYLSPDAGEVTGDLYAIATGVNIKEINDRTVALGRQTMTAFLLTIIFIMFCSIFITRRMTDKIQDINKYIRRINRHGLPDDELIIKGDDDLSETAEEINAMVHGLKERERMAGEMNMGGRIQAEMLPVDFAGFSEGKPFDLWASMEPAREVGGDFYDYFMMDDTHLGIVIADVSGKGVPASLFMVYGKTLLRNAMHVGADLGEVLQNVNKALCAGNTENYFITMWIGCIDLTNGELTMANAAHNPPMLLNANGKYEFLKDLSGTVVGAFDGLTYKQFELKLEKGSKLLLYTDGIVEAHNAKEELYNDDRLEHLMNSNKNLGPKEMIAEIKKDVLRFVGDHEQFDDQTMLMVEIKDYMQS